MSSPISSPLRKKNTVTQNKNKNYYAKGKEAKKLERIKEAKANGIYMN